MPSFKVHFDPEPYASLDRLALLARQDYNLGGTGDWFGEFRGGLYGFYSRLYGVQFHYGEVHAWRPRIRLPQETEYHLASIMFQMDSALECLIFALNALGWAVMPSGFWNITDGKELRRISPLDILGDPSRTPPLAPKSGHGAIFPSLKALWQGQAQLITQIRDLHDVSKHRQTIYMGGMLRSDVPDGFYEALGISKESKGKEDSTIRTLLCPDAEIILKPDAKSPASQRLVSTSRPRDLLEDLVPSFANFINSSGISALADAQANVPLKERVFRSGTTPEVRMMTG